ncbi:MAG: hypothetical protein HRT65_14390 [Flavobacteriaceae bacterium]|nr:hypothetical protein [Flavobacteriaceae bacterium]
MKFQCTVFLALFLLTIACSESTADGSSEQTLNAKVSTEIPIWAKLDGANVLAFGPDNVLFIGDSKGARIYAVTTEATELKDAIPYNLEGFDLLAGEKLGLSPRDVIINDMKIHPMSQEAYVSIKLGHEPSAKSVIAIVNPTTSEIRLLKIGKANTIQVSIDNPASPDLVFWEETPASTLSITDIDYHDGHIYVAGLTNSEFASTLRKIEYPFDNVQESVNSIEMYHAVHTQNETRAPIRTMLFDKINGESTLLASYTCTPLVTIPVDQIEKGANIVGKTIAELGFGNTPIDMLIVTTQGFDGSTGKSLLVTNKNRGGTMIPYESLISGTEGQGMAGQQVMYASGLEGIQEIPLANVMQIDIQNAQRLGVVRRNIETGGIDLISELTGTYLRLSDYISEYDFPDYRYPEVQEGTKQYHDMVKQMEGYPELTSKKMGR